MIPDNTVDYIDLEGTLKEDCSTLNPTVRILRTVSDLVPDTYNYAYIQAFGRYYFIVDCIWSEPFWEIRMAVDVLASWKTEIGLEDHYILRTNSTTTDFDPLITDTMYPATNGYTTRDDTIASDPFHSAMSQGIAGGTYVVGIISGEVSNSVGAITYYAMTPYQFGLLKQMLFSQQNLINMEIIDRGGHPLVDDMSPEILKTMYNPYQYIISSLWFPFLDSVLVDSDEVHSIKIGWWSYDLDGLQIRAQVVSFYQTQVLTNHPQAATRGTYLNYAPYRRASLIGRFGDIPLDMSYYSQASNTVALKYDVDLITGQCKTHIGYQTGSGALTHNEYYMTREFLLAVPIQIAQVGVDYLGVAVTAVDTAANVAGNALSLNIAGTVSAAAHGIYNTLQSTMPQLETGGSNGSFIGAYTEAHLITHYFHIVDEDIAHKGRPLCQIRTLNTLSGYVLCADGEISVPCLDSEKDIISDFLTSGFFWE